MKSTFMKLRSFFSVAVGFCLLFAASGVGAIEPPVLRTGLESEPITLDWQQESSPSDRFILSFLMRGLLRYDEQVQLICDLCKTFEVSADGKSYTFALNPEEAWSDGVALEAKHFVDSFQRLLSPSNRLAAAENFRIIAGAKQTKWDPDKLSIRAEGKHRLVLTLAAPSPVFAHMLTTVAAFPIRKDLVGKGQAPLENHLMTAVLGPYQLAEWARGKRLVLEGNPAYKKPRPVYRVSFALKKHSELVKEFGSGKLDILPRPTTEDVVRLSKHQLQVNPYWAVRMLLFNVQRPLVSDRNFRKAVLYSLNREALPSLLRNGERRSTGVVPPGLIGYREGPLATQDLARASSERVRAIAKNKTATLRLLVRDDENEKRIAEWISQALTPIDVHLRITPKGVAEWKSVIDRGTFDLALVTYGFEVASPIQFLQTFRSGSPENASRWANLAYDALLDQLLTVTPAQSATLIDQATQVLEIQDVVAIPVGYPTEPFLLGPRVLGFAITRFGDPDLVKIRLKQ